MTGICRTSFAQLRALPDHTSELVSQLICGEWVRVLEQTEYWCRVQTEHGYTAWTRTAQLWMVTESQNEVLRQSSLVLNPLPLEYRLDSDSQRLLNITQKQPDGLDLLPDHPVWDVAGFVEKALAFEGVPYVWGGKTPNGLDCSGLVQLCMNLCGFSFPRDAWQQAGCGALIDYGSVEAGDLLFFQRTGKEIHHVAIALGNDLYLHASEWVQVNSLDPNRANFSKDRKDTLVMARKIKEAHLGPLGQSFKSLLVI